MMRMRFPEKFKTIEEGILISIDSTNDCSIQLSNDSIIKGRFVGKQRLFFDKIAEIDKKYFIAIYEELGIIEGRILTYSDFKYDHDIYEGITKIPNYRALLNTL